MPDEFRVGDRVETRRGADIPEDFRQRRAVVEAVSANGDRIKIRFVNPPVANGVARHTHPDGRYWAPDELRLVERTLRLGPEATVIVSDPAYAVYPDGHGSVASMFYGAEVTVVGPYHGYPDNWQVRHRDGTTNYIHQNYLTVIEEGPPQRFSLGDLVMVSRPAYFTRTASVYEEAPSSVAGHVCRIESRVLSGRWCVVEPNAGNMANVHENWLTPYADEAEPVFEVGQVVRVSDSPHAYSEGRSRVAGWEDQEVVVIGTSDPTRPRLRLPSNGTEVQLHQDCLTLVEKTVEVGAHVQIPLGALYWRSGDPMIDGRPGVSGRVGVVTEFTPQGNAKIRLRDAGTVKVHPGFLKVLTPEEAEAVISPGDVVRVGLGDHIPEAIRGRRMEVTEARTDNVFTVVGSDGGRQHVREDWVTRIPVSTGERCSTCPAPPTTTLRDRRYCADCVAECHLCHIRYPIDYRRPGQVYLVGENWECSLCTIQCASCATRVPRAEAEEYLGYCYCANCHHECGGEGCSDTVYGGQTMCDECRNQHGTSALGSYRHTRPAMWLGGPVKNKGGYYIGFEHEITAGGDFTLRQLREWARDHLGHKRGLDPKPDSSVAGFEIATQPMTPAFFEEVDWASYMDMLNSSFPCRHGEPDGHGLHVHIGRQAFRTEKIVKTDSRGRPFKKPKRVMVTDAAMLAAFTFLLSRGHGELERIGRRTESRWALQMNRPVSAAIYHDHSEVRGKQRDKIQHRPPSVPRGAVNLHNAATIEIRAFRSTRDPEELKNAVRVVYLAAEYVRHLRSFGSINPKAVNWAAFAEWVRETMPQAHASIAGTSVRLEPVPVTALMEAFVTDASRALREEGVVNMVDMEAVPEEPSEVLPAFGTPFREGMRVRVADPAFSTPGEDYADGWVDDEFHGQEAMIIGVGDRAGTWRVRYNRQTNEIHENYLTVLEEVRPF